jgi:PAS domain-containing protein
MLLLKGARQIVIVITDEGFTVQEGERYADQLCWDEMLGQIAELTHPELKREGRYRMDTAEGWRRLRESWRKAPGESVVEWSAE